MFVDPVKATKLAKELGAYNWEQDDWVPLNKSKDEYVDFETSALCGIVKSVLLDVVRAGLHVDRRQQKKRDKKRRNQNSKNGRCALM